MSSRVSSGSFKATTRIPALTDLKEDDLRALHAPSFKRYPQGGAGIYPSVRKGGSQVELKFTTGPCVIKFDPKAPDPKDGEMETWSTAFLPHEGDISGYKLLDFWSQAEVLKVAESALPDYDPSNPASLIFKPSVSRSKKMIIDPASTTGEKIVAKDDDGNIIYHDPLARTKYMYKKPTRDDVVEGFRFFGVWDKAEGRVVRAPVMYKGKRVIPTEKAWNETTIIELPKEDSPDDEGFMSTPIRAPDGSLVTTDDGEVMYRIFGPYDLTRGSIARQTLGLSSVYLKGTTARNMYKAMVACVCFNHEGEVSESDGFVDVPGVGGARVRSGPPPPGSEVPKREREDAGESAYGGDFEGSAKRSRGTDEDGGTLTSKGEGHEMYGAMPDDIKSGISSVAASGAASGAAGLSTLPTDED